MAPAERTGQTQEARGNAPGAGPRSSTGWTQVTARPAAGQEAGACLLTTAA